MKITGAVLEEIGLERPYTESKPLNITELDLDDPGPDEVLIRIRAAGLCHSDLSVVDGNRVRPTPMLLGHEASGVVEKVGENVTDLSVGEQVTTVFLPRCGECKNCLTDGKLPCTPGPPPTMTACSSVITCGYIGKVRRFVTIWGSLGSRRTPC